LSIALQPGDTRHAPMLLLATLSQTWYNRGRSGSSTRCGSSILTCHVSLCTAKRTLAIGGQPVAGL